MFRRSFPDARFQRGAGKQVVISGALILLMVPEILQHLTGYTLAVPFGAELIFTIALAAALTAYVLMMLFVWRRSRLAGGVGFALLAIPVVYFGWHLLDFFMLGLLYLPRDAIDPAVSGRLSPDATFRVFYDPGFGDAGVPPPPYTLEIYRNPRWLPFLRKEVRKEPLRCGENGANADPKSLWIHAGSNDRVIIVECRNATAGTAPKQIVLQ
jgi:hypothetical protein